MRSLLQRCRAAFGTLWPKRQHKSQRMRSWWRRFEPLEPRLALAADLPFASLPKVDIDLRLFKQDGTELVSLAAGDPFVL